MANDLSLVEEQGGRKLCTVDHETVEGKMKLLAIVGGSSEAGKDWLPANKPVELEIDDIVIERTQEYVKDDGEIVQAGQRATCVLRSGDMVHFSSYRVVRYLTACLAMWSMNWAGIVLKITKSSSGGKTNYKVEFVREGNWRD